MRREVINDVSIHKTEAHHTKTPQHKCRTRRAGVEQPACPLFVYSDHCPPPFVRPPVLHFATTPSRSLSLPPDTFKSVPLITGWGGTRTTGVIK